MSQKSLAKKEMARTKGPLEAAKMREEERRGRGGRKQDDQKRIEKILMQTP